MIIHSMPTISLVRKLLTKQFNDASVHYCKVRNCSTIKFTDWRKRKGRVLNILANWSMPKNWLRVDQNWPGHPRALALRGENYQGTQMQQVQLNQLINLSERVCSEDSKRDPQVSLFVVPKPILSARATEMRNFIYLIGLLKITWFGWSIALL